MLCYKLIIFIFLLVFFSNLVLCGLNPSLQSDGSKGCNSTWTNASQIFGYMESGVGKWIRPVEGSRPIFLGISHLTSNQITI
ncbi:Hypothetical protein SRAE_2000487650 [Strongyloides ratti]|uniref:Uncharacterized protein n=1 Tax=Strongyloides ratti TaxID=34506 RepID=A0A090LKM1_STRRB|nr:Hypothetical protein SRAE_2000487650 [Strongyloides ratti]CEF70243.1 Hypothetical protein SRAE_2000487650 [Strongyloides ratti]